MATGATDLDNISEPARQASPACQGITSRRTSAVGLPSGHLVIYSLVIYSDFYGKYVRNIVIYGMYPLEMTNIAIENGHV